MTALVAVGDASERYKQFLNKLVSDGFAGRLCRKDTTLWGETHSAEVAERLGWLDFVAAADALIVRAAELRARLNTGHVNRVVLCGMGGSSLAPELICEWANVPLTVLDSSHPCQVGEVADGDLSDVVVVVSSKSGSTAETLSQLALFRDRFVAAGINPSDRIVIITDSGSGIDPAVPGSQTHDLDATVFYADPTVGGRFSALTAFGLVPATLAGAELAPLISDAAALLPRLLTDSVSNPALQLAARLAAATPEIYTAVTLPCEPEYRYLGDWIEQLVAESTGKAGTGVLPISVTGDAPEAAAAGNNLKSLRIFLDDTVSNRPLSAADIAVSGELGEQFVLWEVATAALGYLLRLNPFDQPDVESSKLAARSILAAANTGSDSGVALSGVQYLKWVENPGVDTPRDVLALREMASGEIENCDYLVLQAYLPRTGVLQEAVDSARNLLASHLRIPVAATFGPRYLHSTGQFHKGGPKRGMFIQVIQDGSDCDTQVPGAGHTLQNLLLAQAAGDAAVLRDLGRPVITVTTADPLRAIAELTGVISGG